MLKTIVSNISGQTTQIYCVLQMWKIQPEKVKHGRFPVGTAVAQAACGDPVEYSVLSYISWIVKEGVFVSNDAYDK